MLQMLYDFFRTGKDAPRIGDPGYVRRIFHRTRWQVFLSITVGYAFYYIIRQSYSVIKKPLLASGVVDPAQVGIIGSIFFITYGLGKISRSFAHMIDFRSVFLDTAPFIYVLDGDTPCTEPMEDIFRTLLDHSAQIMTSSVTVAEEHIATFRRGERGLSITFHTTDDLSGFSRMTELVCYRTVQEALANIVRHARAHHVSVTLRGAEDALEACIADDGIGVTQKALKSARQDGHIGLASMQERAELLGGSFSLQSGPCGGTRIYVRLPRKAEAHA